MGLGSFAEFIAVGLYPKLVQEIFESFEILVRMHYMYVTLSQLTYHNYYFRGLAFTNIFFS